MEIYIIRHGQTVWNIDKRLQGSTDIELTKKGLDIAIESGKNLAATRFDVIYSSPLQRAYQTANAFRNNRNIEIITDDRLKELCFGDYEGHTLEELNNKENCKFKYFFDAPEKYEPGTNGETLEHLCERASDFMSTTIEPLSKNPDIERVMIVGHGALNKALMTHVKKHDISQFWSGGLQRNCNVIILDYTDGKYTIIDESKIFYTPESEKYMDSSSGLKLADNDSNMYRLFLQSFLDTSFESKKVILDYYNKNDIENFGIKVHGLKSNAKTIGAAKLSDISKALEAAAGNGDLDFIKDNLPELLDTWTKTISAVKAYLNK